MITCILGTRPEIIKMSPIIRLCAEGNVPFSVVHTGQHYSYEMDQIFFKELDLPAPDIHLDVGSGTHAEQTAKILVGVERALITLHSTIVLVQGDTNTVLGASVAAAKLHIPLGHVESGLRSFNRFMPEEINREIADHLADILFVPTESARQNLLKEGIAPEKITVTGNTIVDAVLQNKKIARKKVAPIRHLGLRKREYFLVTAHREENVDNHSRLRSILEGLRSVAEAYSLPIVFPIHPRTRKRLQEFGLSASPLQVIDPLGFLDFLQLEANARLVLTDSGGVQEEACILGVPCVTLREDTERPETVQVGANVLVGHNPDLILQGVGTMLSRSSKWQNPFGDGTAAKKILKVCHEYPSDIHRISHPFT